MTPIGLFQIVGELARFSISIVYTAASEGSPDARFVIKYMLDCSALEEHIPVDLTREYTLSKVLSGTRVTPEVYYLSPPIAFSAEFGFALSDGQVQDCVAARAQVRYIVEERVGPTLRAYMTTMGLRMRSTRNSREAQIQHILEVVSVGHATLNSLQTLHSTGVVHGDIHDRNLAFEALVNDMLELFPSNGQNVVLLDLGMSGIISNPEEMKSSEFASQRIASPWQLRGDSRGFRDDAFRVLEMMARFMSFGRFDQLFTRIDGSLLGVPDVTSAYFRFKRTVNFFGERQDFNIRGWLSLHFDAYLSYTQVPSTVKTTLSKLFSRLRTAVLELMTPHTPVPYEFLFEELRKIRLLLQKELHTPSPSDEEVARLAGPEELMFEFEE